MYWHGYLSGARCKWIACGPADATATPSTPVPVKSRMVYLFLVLAYPGSPGKKPLNGCSSSSVVFTTDYIKKQYSTQSRLNCQNVKTYSSLFWYFTSCFQFCPSLPSFQYSVILFGIHIEWLVTVINNILWFGYCWHPLNTGHCCTTRYHLTTDAYVSHSKKWSTDDRHHKNGVVRIMWHMGLHSISEMTEARQFKFGIEIDC